MIAAVLSVVRRHLQGQYHPRGGPMLAERYYNLENKK